MATATATEYLDIDGTPLTTAAWTTEDISTLLNGPGTRGGDIVVPGRAGTVARRRTLDAREVSIPIVVNGYLDSDGNAWSDPREGLVNNLDELKGLLTPRGTTLAGTRTLTWYGDYVQRTAQVHVSPNIDVAAIGPHAARVVVRMVLPGGALRGGGYGRFYTPVSSTISTFTFTLDQGNGEVQDAELAWTTEAVWPGPDAGAVLNGDGPPDAGDGSDGDWYIDDLVPALYGPKTSGSWTGYGPFEFAYAVGTPPGTDRNVGPDYVVLLTFPGPTAEVYGPRTFTALGGGSLGTSLVIENLTYGGVALSLDANVDGNVFIDCGAYTATNDGAPAGGSIVVTGTPLWLPLLPGDNELQITAPGLNVDAAFGIQYRGVYL